MSAEIECAVIHSECKETNLRVIGLSVLPLGNITDVAHFLGVSECNTFNFNKSPFKAIVLSELNIQGFSEKLNKNWMPVMDEAVYKSILDHCPDKHPALIIVPSIQQLESTAKELIMWQEKSNEWLYLDISSINKIISTFTTEIIGQMLMHGIGLLFKKMSESDKRTVQELYASRKFKVRKVLFLKFSNAYYLSCICSRFLALDVAKDLRPLQIILKFIFTLQSLFMAKCYNYAVWFGCFLFPILIIEIFSF